VRVVRYDFGLRFFCEIVLRANWMVSVVEGLMGVGYGML
jgi:hypothetical protein